MAKFGKNRREETHNGETGSMVTVRGGRSLMRRDPFDNLFGRMMQPFFGFNEGFGGFRTPRVDIRDNGDTYEVDVELPGVKKEDLEVNVVNGQLEIRATESEDVEETEGDYYLREIGTSSFFRSVPLPADADEDDVEAELGDGCLCIEIGKTGEGGRRGKPVRIK